MSANLVSAILRAPQPPGIQDWEAEGPRDRGGMKFPLKSYREEALGGWTVVSKKEVFRAPPSENKPLKLSVKSLLSSPTLQ